MLLVSEIINNKEAVINGLKKKNVQNAGVAVDSIIKLNDRRKSLQMELDDTLNKSKNIAKKIGLFIRENRKEEAEQAKAETGSLKQLSKTLQERLKETEQTLKEELFNLPNTAHEKVPAGKTPDDNEISTQNGDIPDLGNNALPHWDLIKKYDIIDFDLGNKITGAGFPVYKGKGARLQRALINFFLDEALKAGYKEIQPPVVINSDSGYGTGQLPDKEGQMYGITDSDLYLIPTAEVPLTNLYRDVILRDEDLPIKNVAYSSCFRREAGSWGSHVRGLNRLHQFDKVELVQICKPAESYDVLDSMCQYVQELLTKLELPYRKLLLCGGDLGFTSAMTYDWEVYSAGQKKWLEVSSVSNFETYQASRLKLRYKDEGKKTQLLHTLNGSALALPRIVAAILENNQTVDGISIPKVLVPYTGFSIIT